MRLSSTAADHFERPRNVGALADATHTACVTNPVCGDSLTLTLRVEGNRIADARFQAEGCAPTYAAASLLTVQIIGQKVTWAASLDPPRVTNWLGGLPPGKEHAAHLAIDALREALRSPRSA